MSASASQEQPPPRLVVGTDGSPPARRAVQWAAQEASSWGRPLHLVHTVDVGPEAARYTVGVLLDAARSLLSGAAADVTQRFPELPVSTAVRRGEPASGILAEAGPADVVVVGSRGLGGFSGLLLGSVGLRVAARSAGPTVVVRGTDGDTPTGGVVAAVRDERDHGMLRFAASAAVRRRAPLRMLSAWRLRDLVGTVVPQVDEISSLLEEEAKMLVGMAETVRREYPDLQVSERLVRTVSPAGMLVEAAAGADLLVLGAHRPGTSATPRLGRVTHAVLHHTPCPVAVVPHGTAA